MENFLFHRKRVLSGNIYSYGFPGFQKLFCYMNGILSTEKPTNSRMEIKIIGLSFVGVYLMGCVLDLPQNSGFSKKKNMFDNCIHVLIFSVCPGQDYGNICN